MNKTWKNDKGLSIQKILCGTVLSFALIMPGAVIAEKNPSDRGKEDFYNYCAVCHGISGKGDGPVSKHLKIPPANLTALTATNNGTFPQQHVMNAIQGNRHYDRQFRTHGPKEMPIWGNVFYEDSHNRNLVAKSRIKNVVRYIESLQK